MGTSKGSVALVSTLTRATLHRSPLRLIKDPCSGMDFSSSMSRSISSVEGSLLYRKTICFPDFTNCSPNQKHSRIIFRFSMCHAKRKLCRDARRGLSVQRNVKPSWLVFTKNASRIAPQPRFMRTLLDEGEYHCSIRTMYRLLEQRGESRERRDQLMHPPYRKPELLATAPISSGVGTSPSCSDRSSGPTSISW